MKPHIHTITELAIFTAIAFIFSYIESLFPLPIPFPGIKLGLANLVIVLVLYKNGFCQALTVSIVRGLLNAFTFGSLFGFLYSLAGSVLSLIIMNLLKNKNRLHISAFGVSIAGGITHNIGQFAVAAWLVGPSAILPYFPFLYFYGLIAGGLIGAFVLLCRQRIPLFSSTN